MPGVRKAAKQAGEVGVFAGMTACPPLRGVARADQGPNHDCAPFNEAVLDYIRDHQSIAVVLLSARWALAAEAVRAPGEQGQPAYLVPAKSRQEAEIGPEHNFPT